MRELTERNRQIVERVEAGYSYAQVGTKYGLSKMRVAQIYHRHLARISTTVQIVPQPCPSDIQTA